MSGEPFGPGKLRVVSDGLPATTKVEVLQPDGSWLTLRGVQSLSFGIKAGDWSKVTLDLFLFEAHAEFVPENVTINMVPPDELSQAERELVRAMRARPPTPEQEALINHVIAQLAEPEQAG